MATDFASFADLSGVVQSLVKDLEGKVLSQTDLIKHLPKFVLVAWTNNLSIDKAEAQILAAVKHLITKFVPVAQQAVVIGFVNSAFPAIVIALNGLIEQVKAEVLKKATGIVGDVAAKAEVVCSKSCLPWMSALFAKAPEKPVAAPAADPVATSVVAAPEVVAAPVVPAEVVAEAPVAQSVEAAASSDIAAALASASEEAPVAKAE
jgi:hypothetical protein